MLSFSLSLSVSVYPFSSIIGSKIHRRKEKRKRNKEGRCSLSLSLFLSAFLCLCLSLYLFLCLYLSLCLCLSVSVFLSVYSFSSIVGIDRFENPSKIHRRKEKRRRNKEGRCSSRMIPFSILFGTQG